MYNNSQEPLIHIEADSIATVSPEPVRAILEQVSTAIPPRPRIIPTSNRFCGTMSQEESIGAADSAAFAVTPDASRAERVQQTLDGLSIEDKLSLISGASIWTLRSDILQPPQQQQPLPTLRLSDGPHGLRKTVTEESMQSHPATCFPTGSALAATWNAELMETAVGNALAKECEHHGVHVLLGPAMNIQRHPCCGRTFEYLSEDPIVSGKIAAALVRGIQSTGKVGACLKHVCVNHQEHRRFVVSTVVDERTLREIYLKAYEVAICGSTVGSSDGNVSAIDMFGASGNEGPDQGSRALFRSQPQQQHRQQPWALMCAYNKLNGTYCSEHRWLFQELIRNQWKFAGIVVTDWGATNHRVNGIQAGIDLEMPGSHGVHDAHIQKALRVGQIQPQQLDECVSRIIDLHFKVWDACESNVGSDDGSDDAQRTSADSNEHVDDVNSEHSDDGKERTGDGSTSSLAENDKESEIPSNKSMLDKHHQIAYRVALEAPVLLKNSPISSRGLSANRKSSTKPVLPFAHDRSLAVIGEFAKCPRLQGMGSSQVNPYRTDSVWDSIIGSSFAINVSYARGYSADDPGTKIRPSEIDEARQMAEGADQVLLMVGLPDICESEAYDRTSWDLPLHHLALIDAVLQANPNTAVVIVSGSPTIMSPWIHKAASVVQSFLLGQAGGKALVDLLFGKESFSGKLAMTFPTPQGVHDVPAYQDFPGHDQVEYREGLHVGYRRYCCTPLSNVQNHPHSSQTDMRRMQRYTSEVQFPFGHGLSYTTFDYSSMRLNVTHDEDEHKRVDLSFCLSNTGSMSAAETWQLYVKKPGTSTVDHPDLELKDFGKVKLRPRESREISIIAGIDCFSFWDVGHQAWIVEPGEYTIMIGASSQDMRLVGTVRFIHGRQPSSEAQISHPPRKLLSSEIVRDHTSNRSFQQMLGPNLAFLASSTIAAKAFPFLTTTAATTTASAVAPFHRNSLLCEISKRSWIGYCFSSMVYGSVWFKLKVWRDPGLGMVARAMTNDMPLRGIVLFSSGNLSFNMIDGIIDALNGHWIQLFRRCWRGLTTAPGDVQGSGSSS